MVMLSALSSTYAFTLCCVGTCVSLSDAMLSSSIASISVASVIASFSSASVPLPRFSMSVPCGLAVSAMCVSICAWVLVPMFCMLAWSMLASVKCFVLSSMWLRASAAVTVFDPSSNCSAPSTMLSPSVSYTDLSITSDDDTPESTIDPFSNSGRFPVAPIALSK